MKQATRKLSVSILAVLLLGSLGLPQESRAGSSSKPKAGRSQVSADSAASAASASDQRLAFSLWQALIHPKTKDAARKSMTARLDRFLSRNKSCGAPGFRSAAQDWASHPKQYESSRKNAAALYFILGDRQEFLSWTVGKKAEGIPGYPSLRKRMTRSMEYPSYRLFLSWIAQMRGKKPLCSPPSPAKVQRFLTLSAQSARAALAGLRPGHRKIKPPKPSDPFAGHHPGSGHGGSPASPGGTPFSPGEPPVVVVPPETPPVPFPQSGAGGGASAGYDAKALYEDGAYVMTIPGRTPRKISIKLYSSLMPGSDPNNPVQFDQIGIFDITDPNGRIFGKKFPAQYVKGQDVFKNFHLDDLSQSDPQYSLRINPDGTFSFGLARGKPATPPDASFQNLYKMRAEQVQNSGHLEKIGDQYFLVAGQGGGVGSLLFYSADSSGRLTGDGSAPDMLTDVVSVNNFGRPQRLGGLRPLGYVGVDEQGKPQYWYLHWNGSEQSFVPAPGDPPGSDQPPSGSSATVTDTESLDNDSSVPAEVSKEGGEGERLEEAAEVGKSKAASQAAGINLGRVMLGQELGVPQQVRQQAAAASQQQ